MPDVVVGDVFHDEHHVTQKQATGWQNEGNDEVLDVPCLVNDVHVGSDIRACTALPKPLPTMKLALSAKATFACIYLLRFE